MNTNQNKNVEANVLGSNLTVHNDQDDDSSIEIVQVIRTNQNIKNENSSATVQNIETTITNENVSIVNVPTTRTPLHPPERHTLNVKQSVLNKYDENQIHMFECLMKNEIKSEDQYLIICFNEMIDWQQIKYINSVLGMEELSEEDVHILSGLEEIKNVADYQERYGIHLKN